MNIFDFVNSINAGKDLTEDKETDFKEYVPYLTNKAFSYHIDTILYANEMNLYPDLDGKTQYQYLINTIKPRKRYAKWTKAERSEDLDLVQDTYQVNKNKAKKILRILSKEDLEEIRTKRITGG